MRSYGQYCGLAKALDAIGDRWSLLIVRELMLSGPARYTDLRRGLPGIATNLLADRLRDLEAAGVVRREDAPPPVATTLFHLTDRGHQLRPAMLALGSWGASYLADAPDTDAFRSHWLALPLERFLTDHTPYAPPVTIEIRTGDQPVIVETTGGKIRVRPGATANPDAAISGPHRSILGFLAGRIDLETAQAQGLRLDGDPATLDRVRAKLRVRS
jgi:DNA-binding HxlR family transcriptional regulator